MPKQVFINYWIGQEPNPPSPTLDQMPAYVDIVPLAFVGITTAVGIPDLDFSFLTQHFPAETIQGWIRKVQANGTKVLFSINDVQLGTIQGPALTGFVKNVANHVAAWGVDGIDFDYEPQPFVASDTLVPLIEALRAALPEGSVLTAPIFGPWADYADFLSSVAGAVDWISTMDYTPYPGLQSTISNCETYASIMGGWSKLVIGVSCMGPPGGPYPNFTALDDVKTLSAYMPQSGEAKGGAMLYTYSYDVTSRNGGTTGTGYPDGTWTEAIEAHLP